MIARTIKPEQFNTIEDTRTAIMEAAALLGILQNAVVGPDGSPAPSEIFDAASGIRRLLEAASSNLDTVASEIMKGKLYTDEAEPTAPQAPKEDAGKTTGKESTRSKWTIIRRADYEGSLAPCSCGQTPEVYVVDPVGLLQRAVMPKETVFFAVRCKECGRTGKLAETGLNAFGNYIDETRAAELAAEAWNREQAEA